MPLKFCRFFCISPTTERADSGNAYRGMFGLKTHCFFKEKKLLPDVGIFRKISRIRKQPGFDVLFLLCLCVCFFFFVCFFLRARAELFGTRPSIKQKKNCAYPKVLFFLKVALKG